MKKTISAALASMATALLVGGCVPTAPGLSSAGISLNPVGAVTEAASASSEPVTYHNKTYGFSYTIPAKWSKQQGEAGSESELFMRVPIADSCSFQYQVTPMRKSFPAASAVKAGVTTGKEDIEIGKLVKVDRRDDSRKDKTKVIGWQIEEKGSKGGHKRIIWQAYDSNNRYYNFNAAAYTDKFEPCRADLESVIKSIKFD